MTASRIVLLTSLLLASAPALAGLTIEGKPKVVFHAEGSPGVLTFDGVTKQINLADDGANLVFTVPIDTVQTGIELRDDHMRRNYVQTDQFPNVTLTLPRGEITWPESGDTEGSVTGTFNAHGVDRLVQVAYTIKKTKTGMRVKATFPFNTSDHGIEIPSYLGVTIKPDMTADVTVDLVDAG
ncbi:MAG: YceI family protein [Myxococcales bacterium]|nr:YceI family protein [Myxococcales bacterium]